MKPGKIILAVLNLLLGAFFVWAAAVIAHTHTNIIHNHLFIKSPLVFSRRNADTHTSFRNERGFRTYWTASFRFHSPHPPRMFHCRSQA